VVRRHGTAQHREEMEPDSHYEWVSPDERVRLPFSRERGAVLGLAERFDLCISGDALLHIQQHQAESLFVPLAQVGATGMGRVGGRGLGGTPR
jgi:hypothetical protein